MRWFAKSHAASMLRLGWYIYLASASFGAGSRTGVRPGQLVDVQNNGDAAEPAMRMDFPSGVKVRIGAAARCERSNDPDQFWRAGVDRKRSLQYAQGHARPDTAGARGLAACIAYGCSYVSTAELRHKLGIRVEGGNLVWARNHWLDASTTGATQPC